MCLKSEVEETRRALWWSCLWWLLLVEVTGGGVQVKDPYIFCIRSRIILDYHPWQLYDCRWMHGSFWNYMYVLIFEEWRSLLHVFYYPVSMIIHRNCICFAFIIHSDTWLYNAKSLGYFIWRGDNCEYFQISWFLVLSVYIFLSQDR